MIHSCFRFFALTLILLYLPINLSSETRNNGLRPMYQQHIEAIENQVSYITVPEFGKDWEWFNSQPLSLEKELKGKIIVLDFWTYCCINCMHILPDLAELEEKYVNAPVAFIGVHSAKFAHEKCASGIRHAVQRYNIQHPVVNDAEMLLWRHLGVRSWPTLVVLSPSGKLLLAFEGEGNKEDLDNFLTEALHFYGARGELDTDPIAIKPEQSFFPSSNSPLRFPAKLAIDPQREWLFISDSNHNRIVITDLNGQLIGTVGEGAEGLRDGDFSSARFNRPQGLAIQGNHLYVADCENHALRLIDLSKKTVETLAGNGSQGYDYEGGDRGPYQSLSSPWDVAVHDGKVYIAMAGTHQIWVHDISSRVTRAYSGSGAELNLNHSRSLMKAAWAQPSGLSIHDDVLFIADSESSSIRSIDLKGESTATLVGGDDTEPRNLFAFGDRDGRGSHARLQHPLGIIALGDTDKVVVADTYNHRIKLLDPASRSIKQWIGSGHAGNQDGPSHTASFNEPSGFALSPNGQKLYVADTNNHQIRVIDLISKGVSTLNIVGLSPHKQSENTKDRLTDTSLARTLYFNKRKMEAGGEGEIRFKITLPENYQYTEEAESRWQLLPGYQQPVHISKENLSGFLGEQETVQIPFTVPDDFTGGTIKLELIVFFCKQESSCYVDSVIFEFPLEKGTDDCYQILFDYVPNHE